MMYFLQGSFELMIKNMDQKGKLWTDGKRDHLVKRLQLEFNSDIFSHQLSVFHQKNQQPPKFMNQSLNFRTDQCYCGQQNPFQINISTYQQFYLFFMQKPQSSLQKSRTIGNYIITKNLGQGTFGKVKLGIHSVSGQKVAIKILEKSKIIDVADVQRVTREIHILKQIRHPNLIQLYEIIETPKQLFLVMEFISEGELFQQIVKKKRLKESEACEFFRQLIEGVEYMHELNIVHRDLKPQNLLIDFNRRLKIVDFGLSNTYKNKELLKTACGSPCYAAPEMIAGKRYQGLNADIWSCGVILFAMICGYLPFEDPNTSYLYKKITAGDYTIPKFVSPFARELITRLLTTDPERRIKIAQIKKHAWYRQPIDLEFTLTIGIKVGMNKIPIDEDVLNEVVSLSPEHEYEQVRKFISNNRHNHSITLYYLILKRNLRNGICSKFDICSPNFNPENLQDQADALNAKNKSNQDLEEIQLDRMTTATGPRTFRALTRGGSNRQTNASESPDITAHNFYMAKNKIKLKKDETEDTNAVQESSNLGNLIDPLNYPPTSQRRKIYFQAPTKSILNNSIDLKSFRTSNNPQQRTERLVQKSQRMEEKSEKLGEKEQKGTLEISLYDINDKKQALTRFFHNQERKNSIKQPMTFRTSINRTQKLSIGGPSKKYDEHSVRQSLATRDGYGTDRYISLDISQMQSGHEKGSKRKSNPNAIELMNRTFMGGMTTRVPRIFGFKVQNETDKIKSMLSNTITAGFNRRRNSTRQKNTGQIGRFEY